MAKWGEGDPRWIVEERADATNVNNWHWTEKNATQWSKDTLKRLLENTSIENDECTCMLTSVSKCEGEAIANNRKAKLIFFYEWQIEIQWNGSFKMGDNKTKYSGTLEIPNLSEENQIEEVDVLVTCSSSTDEAHRLKQFLSSNGAVIVRAKLAEYLKLLKEEYSRNLILPTKDNINNLIAQQDKSQPAALSNAADLMRNAANAESVDRMRSQNDGTFKALSLTEEFFCTPDDLYKVLTTKELVQAFTRTEAIVEPAVDGNYSIFGGNITGNFTALTPPNLIEMRWRKRDWPKGHASEVKLEISAFGGGSRLVLNQTGVPSHDLENTKGGWQTHFFASLKQTYGYGGRMF